MCPSSSPPQKQMVGFGLKGKYHPIRKATVTNLLLPSREIATTEPNVQQGNGDQASNSFLGPYCTTARQDRVAPTPPPGGTRAEGDQTLCGMFQAQAAHAEGSLVNKAKLLLAHCLQHDVLPAEGCTHMHTCGHHTCAVQQHALTTYITHTVTCHTCHIHIIYTPYMYRTPTSSHRQPAPPDTHTTHTLQNLLRHTLSTPELGVAAKDWPVRGENAKPTAETMEVWEGSSEHISFYFFLELRIVPFLGNSRAQQKIAY